MERTGMQRATGPRHWDRATTEQRAQFITCSLSSIVKSPQTQQQREESANAPDVNKMKRGGGSAAVVPVVAL